MRRWHDEGEAETIGDVGGFGGTACITVELGDHDVVLNVDSKRRAVATYLDHVRRLGPDLPWRVVANHRGTVNKVVAAQARAIVPDGVEAAIELVGTNTLPDTLRATAVHGVVCFTGMLSNQWTVADFYPIEYIPTGVRLTAYGGDAADLPTDVLQAYLDAVAAGRLTVPIDRTYALDEIAQAHADMEHGRAPGKLVVLP